MYKLSEQNNPNNEKSSVELSLRPLAEASKKKSNIESKEAFIAEASNLLRQIKSAYKHDDTIQNIIQAKMSRQKKLPLEIIKNNVKLELRDCKIHEDLLYVNNRLYIPDDPELRTKIIRDIHDSPPGGHAGRSSTYNQLSRHYYWSRMTDSITRYVKNCHTYKRSKIYREDKQELLKPLFIPDRY